MVGTLEQVDLVQKRDMDESEHRNLKNRCHDCKRRLRSVKRWFKVYMHAFFFHF